MLVAMKPNAPNQLNQFDRATVNRPPDAGAIRGLQGGELRPHHFNDHGACPIVPCRAIRRMTLVQKHANKSRPWETAGGFAILVGWGRSHKNIERNSQNAGLTVFGSRSNMAFTTGRNKVPPMNGSRKSSTARTETLREKPRTQLGLLCERPGKQIRGQL